MSAYFVMGSVVMIIAVGSSIEDSWGPCGPAYPFKGWFKMSCHIENIILFVLRLLKDKFHLQFEENTTRSDLPCKCYFVTTTSRAFRPSVVDLSIPDSKGIFKTPNPSPNTSAAGTPIEGNTLDELCNMKMNSLELQLTKLKVNFMLYASTKHHSLT